MGCSNPHPHGQIWTTTGLPEEPASEIEQFVKYRKENSGRNLLEDYAKLEMEKEERIVFQNEGFLVVCPWWATWPFEVMIVSKPHRRSLVDLSEKEREEFAEAVAEVTTTGALSKFGRKATAAGSRLAGQTLTEYRR